MIIQLLKGKKRFDNCNRIKEWVERVAELGRKDYLLSIGILIIILIRRRLVGPWLKVAWSFNGILNWRPTPEGQGFQKTKKK